MGNTAFFDKCLGWRGVCVEPNPFLGSFLRAYRGCQVFQNCVDEVKIHGKPFSYPDGQMAFGADCLPLSDILTRAGLLGRRIDVLSIDVGAALPFEYSNTAFIVIEVTQGARWLEVDTILLPRGYAKVAVIGRDVVYTRLEELTNRGLASWPFLQE